MRLSRLFEDQTKFQSLDDVRTAGVEDLEKVNKGIEDTMKAMQEITKKVTGGRESIDKLRVDIDKALEDGDRKVLVMLNNSIKLNREQVEQATSQYEMHSRHLEKLKHQQNKLTSILNSQENLEKIYDKIQNPGDLTKEAPADAILDRMNQVRSQPDTASPTDFRGIGRQL